MPSAESNIYYVKFIRLLKRLVKRVPVSSNITLSVTNAPGKLWDTLIIKIEIFVFYLLLQCRKSPCHIRWFLRRQESTFCDGKFRHGPSANERESPNSFKVLKVFSPKICVDSVSVGFSAVVFSLPNLVKLGMRAKNGPSLLFPSFSIQFLCSWKSHGSAC